MCWFDFGGSQHPHFNVNLVQQSALSDPYDCNALFSNLVAVWDWLWHYAVKIAWQHCSGVTTVTCELFLAQIIIIKKIYPIFFRLSWNGEKTNKTVFCFYPLKPWARLSRGFLVVPTATAKAGFTVYNMALYLDMIIWEICTFHVHTYEYVRWHSVVM